MKTPVSKAVTLYSEGNKIELHIQDDMILVIAESNKTQQHTIKKNPFMVLPLLDIFGHLVNKQMVKK